MGSVYSHLCKKVSCDFKCVAVYQSWFILHFYSQSVWPHLNEYFGFMIFKQTWREEKPKMQKSKASSSIQDVVVCVLAGILMLATFISLFYFHQISSETDRRLSFFLKTYLMWKKEHRSRGPPEKGSSLTLIIESILWKNVRFIYLFIFFIRLWSCKSKVIFKM